MEINRIYNLFFSPTGSTKSMLGFMSRSLKIGFGSAADIEDIDMTPYQGRNMRKAFSDKDLVFIGVPSYAGRVPAVFADRLKRVEGKRAAAVLVVTFGNRAYEDTLIELKDLAQKQGFRVIAAAAASVRHSIIEDFGAGRPDEKDKQELRAFCRKAAEKVKSLSDGAEDYEPDVPGARPYKQAKSVPLAPLFAKEDCIGCGACAASCPAGAIDEEYVCAGEKCISCMRCVKVCPMSCRYVKGEIMEKLRAHLEPLCKSRKANEFFV